MSLARALSALEEGRDDDAHAAIAEAWRQRRAPGIARLAELADARSPAPIRAKLAALMAPRVATVLEKFSALEHEDDPLLASWVLRALEEPPFTGPSSRPLLEALVDAAKRLCDPRLLARAKTIAHVWELRVTPKPSRVALAKRLEQAVAWITAQPPRAATEEEARLESALGEKLRPVAATMRTAEDLFAEVYANPRDDAARLVLADFLLEQGDVRGELIALQFKRRDGGLDAAADAREHELLKKHGKAWLGPLAPVISWGKGYSQSEFERGFLARADIILSVGKKLELMLDEPSWAVVEELLGTWPHELLHRAPLRGLRKLECGAEPLVDLAQRKLVFPSLDRLATNEGAHDWDALHALFPLLRTLIVTFERGPTVEEVASTLAASRGIQRIAFQRWLSNANRPTAVPFERLVEETLSLPATVPEVALEPTWQAWPRPAPVELRIVDGRYVVMQIAPEAPVNKRRR